MKRGIGKRRNGADVNLEGKKLENHNIDKRKYSTKKNTENGITFAQHINVDVNLTWKDGRDQETHK